MADAFLGEIRIFAGNFAPRGWTECNGQLLLIAQNTALFSVLGTTFGGDGRTTMGVPGLQGRVPMGQGRGPGLTARRMGDKGGEETHTLTMAEMANHNHKAKASQVPANEDDPGVDYVLATPSAATIYAPDANPTAMNAASLPSVGGNGAHQNMQPFLPLLIILALVGEYPPRS